MKCDALAQAVTLAQPRLQFDPTNAGAADQIT
jgi:hypothetical protein